ncbi:MAG TPA: LysR family transcriptional regulator [Burkholderiales bacterium]|nr:LysR family transcriptional regulator [Burkholderiales bacterium]
MNIHEVDLNLLRVLDAVLRDRSVSAAAARLGLSQPAVSNALARLRRVFGDALFVRTPRGMQATAFAQELAAPVHQALSLIEAALAQRAGFDPAVSERVFRIYMSDIGEMVFLPPLVQALRCRAPSVRLETHNVALEEIPGALSAGRLDLAVGFLPGLAAPVHRRRFFRDPYVCLMRADHPVIGARLTRKLFLEASHALVSSFGSGHSVIEETLERNGLTRRIALRVPHFTVVPLVLERTDLLLTVPERVARLYERSGGFKWLRPPVAIAPADVGVHWHERFEHDPANRWLREQMLGLFAE